ncbi:hypothetical protein GGQ88_004075 [Novosphingobium hassiacum]|jgi:hypothetical protein|uniref:Uncharacterized protein n=1 Tax=Novosphingobium hassiacum TaxID=173676 RepID=A0A7W6EXW0_9SPHN|nr:hypothetical protein [Novosphingobium hassiacum]MBB3862773.1 hypothetical protein [Novosphingobium hassiacum]
MSEDHEGRTKRTMIGRDRFGKISQVEGLQLSFTARAEFDSDEKRGLTHAERRKRIIAKYLKK